MNYSTIMHIASAPKDGTRIVMFDPESETWYTGQWNATMGNGCWNCDSNNYIPKPTHYIDLPKSPCSHPSLIHVKDIKGKDFEICECCGYSNLLNF